MAKIKDKRPVIIASAIKLAKQGKLEAAIKEYEKVLNFKPDDYDVRRIIGDLYLKLSNVAEAVKQFEMIADFYIKDEYHPKAIAMLKRITKIDPKNENVFFKLAELYSVQGLMMEAKQIYIELSEEYKRKGDIKNALKMYERILEFDSSNIQMRLLLAENYLKENMQDDAVKEYLIVSDILIRNKEYDKVETILTKVISKINNEKIVEKLANNYIKQGKVDKAIQFLQNLGSEIFNFINLLKLLGDLYLDKKLIKEAKQIYLKIAQINPQETEVITKLGRVYLESKEYEKAYSLFKPVVESKVAAKKYEEAIIFLRLILTANSSFAPAREKMAEIFRISKKKTSLIKVLESLIPIYDNEKKNEKLMSVLEELISISETPYEYEEKLKELQGGASLGLEEDISSEDEYLNHNFRKVDEAMLTSDYVGAEKILKEMREKFPGNINISMKLYDLYEQSKNREMQLEEGFNLHGLYTSEQMYDEASELLDVLAKLAPDNNIVRNLLKDEKTAVVVDFNDEDVKDEMEGINAYDSSDNIGSKDDSVNSGIFELTDEDIGVAPVEDISKRVSSSSQSSTGITDPNEMTKAGSHTEKSLRNLLNELNFQIGNKLFDEAEKLIDELKISFPDNEDVKEAIEKFKALKNETTDQSKILNSDSSINLEIESEMTDEINTDIHLIEDESKSQKEDTGISLEISEEVPQSGSESDVFKFDVDDKEKLSVKEKKKEEPLIGENLLDDIFQNDESINTKSDTKPPFSEDVVIEEFDGINDFGELDGDDLFGKEPALFDSSNYFSLKDSAKSEVESIGFWLKEIERQRTSTIEKNMMEIFEEFKKGVEDKIGQDDYDTRYNLGIAYKEMGLLDEAIHEFLISSRHPLKLFDSAGLLGICFREKGMYGESVNWFKKALGLSGRQPDEYLNIKYELISCYELSDDTESALELAKEILDIDPNFRDIAETHNRLMGDK